MLLHCCRPTQGTAGGNALAEAISHAFIFYSCAIFQKFVKTIVHTNAETMFFHTHACRLLFVTSCT